MQAKAYIESPKVKKLEDITWIKDVYECSSSHLDHNFISSSVTGKLIFCTYLFLNTLILLFTILYFGKAFNWIEQPQHKKLKELLKASAIVLTIVNFGTFLNDIIAHTLYSISYTQDGYYYPGPMPLNAIDYGIYLILKIVLVFLIFIFDITVSCFNTCKRRHGCSSAMYALALCQIIWFIHRIATDIIIFVIVFTVAPAQALGMVTLLLSIIVCAVLFVSLLLKQCYARLSCNNCIMTLLCKKDAFPTICCTFLVAICTIGLISTVTFLFIALVDNGLQSAGVGGFILSLVPPIAVFVIGLCINREFAINFYRNVLTSNSTVTRSAPADENVNTQTDEYTQLAQTPVACN